MRDLLPYFEAELSRLRGSAQQFAGDYPKIAGRLQLGADVAEDPHVERLIQAFAFLTARINLKLDDEFPEVTDALLGILYPHLLRPIPSMSIVQMVIDPDQMSISGRYTVPRHAELFSRPVEGVPCRFRSCYPVDLWPLRVAEARVYVDRCLNQLAGHEVEVGRYYLKAGQYQAAISRLSGVFKKYPNYYDRAEAYYLLGQAYMLAGDKAKSSEAFNALFNQFPQSEFILASQKFIEKNY